MTGPWWESGNCAGSDEFTQAGPRQQVKTCEGCPVRSECLDEALRIEANDPALPSKGWPVRGGLTGEQRRKLILQAGRPSVRQRRMVDRRELVAP